MSEYPIAASIPAAAHALRPMRIDKRDHPIHYTATTFPRGAYAGCELTIRRMECFGMLVPQSSQLEGSRFVDVLDAEGDILDTIGVTQKGFEYMRRVLGVRREEMEQP